MSVASKQDKALMDTPAQPLVQPEGGKRKLYNPKRAVRPAFLVTINDIPD